MKILRSVNRRSADITTAGGYTFHRPNRWFPASRLPDRFPRIHLSDPSKAAPRSEPVELPTILIQPVEERHWIRTASLVIAAIAITLLALRSISGDIPLW
jgi:hypothetical protein